MGASSHARSGPPDRLGKYEILAPIAQGGTSEVFLARLAGTGGFEKIAVVKRLLDHLAEDREFVDMFLDEARLGAQLDHSNIVQTIDLGAVDGHYFIAMEYLPGLSLAQLAKRAQQRAGGMPVELTLGIGVQACAGLNYAHERERPDGTPLRLVHRDVSPQNLIVTYEGVVKIVDFGIAHAAQDARDARTKAGFIKGKFAYMSPEQCLGKPFDRRTDVFAIGVVLHEMLTGQRLFKRDSTYKTYQAIVAGEVTVPSQVNRALSPEIDAVILRALAHDPEERYQTAEALGEALEQVLHARRKHVTAADIARFLDRHFQQEIQQQARMMRELLSGEATSILTVPWHEMGGEGEAEEEINELSMVELMEASSSSSTPIDPEPRFESDEERDDRTSGMRAPPRASTGAGKGKARIDDLEPPTVELKKSVVPTAAPRATTAPAAPVVAEAPLPRPRAATPAASTMPQGVPALAGASLADPPSRTVPVRAAPARPMWIYPAAFVVALGVGLGLVLLTRLL